MVYAPFVKFAQATVQNCKALSDDTGSICETGLPKIVADNDIVVKALQQFIFPAIAAVALFFIIMSGLKMITAQGDPQSLSKARKSIIYAAMGLAIVLTAEAIVTWVIGRL